MPDGPAGEKTELPTPKRLRDAREKGNVPKSKDLSGALELIGAVVLLKYGGWYMAHHMRSFTTKVIAQDMASLDIPQGKEIIPYAIDWCMNMGVIIVPFMVALCFVAYVANFVQIGWLVTSEPLKLNLGKLNPVAGFKRMFSVKNLVMLAMNLAKLVVIASIAWLTVRAELEKVIVLVEMEPAGIFAYMTNAVLNLALQLACLLFILGVADYWYQKHKHTDELKMTKQEVKEEYKQMEGDPKVKAKRRQIQMQQAMKRMMKEVPEAEVVVRNPTHYAVAISFNETMTLPVVVAKGKNKIAEKIIEEAKKARVPLVENPPLARELYKQVEVGDAIPEQLFAAVAEILAMVMSSDKKQKFLRSYQSKAA